jgi:hypothetical protein
MEEALKEGFMAPLQVDFRILMDHNIVGIL